MGGDCCAAGLLQTLSCVLSVSRCDQKWYLYRRRSVSVAGSVSSQSVNRPSSNRSPRMLVAQRLIPHLRSCLLKLFSCPVVRPEAHEVSVEHETDDLNVSGR